MPGLRTGAAATAAIGIALFGAASAQATYPGSNGAIIFGRTDTSQYHPVADLYAAAADGTGERLFFKAQGQTSMEDPSFSADGGRVAWEGASRFGFGTSWVANSDGTGAQELTYESKQPALSPDGTRLAYRHDSASDTPEFPPGLYVSDIDGANRVSLGLFRDPDWSPDGTTLVAAEDGDGHQSAPADADIFAIPAGGGTPRQLTNTAAQEYDPSWSPDGAWIAYARTPQNGNSEVWVMRSDGSDQHRLVEGWRPVWSPDGTTILFDRVVGDSGGIWKTTPAGAAPVQLIAGGHEAAWQPLAHVPDPDPQPGPPEPPANNHAPRCSTVGQTVHRLPWRPNRRMYPVRLTGGKDPDGDRVKVAVLWVGQDEHVMGYGDHTSPDAAWTKEPRIALVRNERSVHGDGRVYFVDFSLTDRWGARCIGTRQVRVRRWRHMPAIVSPFYTGSLEVPLLPSS